MRSKIVKHALVASLAILAVASSTMILLPEAQATEYANVYVGNDWKQCVSDGIDVCIPSDFKSPINDMAVEDYGRRLALRINVKKIIITDDSNPYDLHETKNLPYDNGDALEFGTYMHTSTGLKAKCLYTYDGTDYLRDSVIVAKHGDGTWTSSLASVYGSDEYMHSDKGQKNMSLTLESLPKSLDPLSSLMQDRDKSDSISSIDLSLYGVDDLRYDIGHVFMVLLNGLIAVFMGMVLCVLYSLLKRSMRGY